MPSLSIKAITPKNIPQTKQYLDAIKRATKKTINAAQRDYKSTARTWRHKPEFVVVEDASGGDYLVATGTDNLIYKWTDEGTRPHIIRPRRSAFLRFKVGGRAKTTPGVIGSQAGAVGTDWRSAQFVLHPGTTARRFTKTIQSRRQKTLEQEISQNIAKVARTQR